jgi:pyridoxal phosphate enzyme (YggS family)
MNSIASRLIQIQERIARAEREFGRAPGSTRLLAVSKQQPVAALREALAAGQRCFGENYLQEALPKIQALAAEQLEWHHIGRVQSNKTREIAGHFHWVHGVDRLKIARRLGEQRPTGLPLLNICLQVKLSDEAGKGGLEPQALAETAAAISELPGLALRGLMALPAPEQDFAAQRRPFRRLRELLDMLNSKGLQLDTLSMGTSADMEAAIAEGATIVRIGTGIFGPRNNTA